jgi:biopolymer transport protein ExbD
VEAGRRKSGAPKGDINVTPLVDVVLVLLIIFMVITPMLQRGADVELPITENPDKSKEVKEQITISVGKDNRIWWETDVIDDATLITKMEELFKTAPTTPIFVKGDTLAVYGRVRGVMKLISEAGFESVGVITKEVEPTPGKKAA